MNEINFDLDKLVKNTYSIYSSSYPELVSIFNEYSESIENHEQKKDYVIDAGKMLSSIKRVGIPQKVLTNLPHPEMIPYVKRQEIKSSCGTSCIRTVLLLNYGFISREKDMWNIMKENGGGNIKDGTSPMQIANIMRHLNCNEKLNYKESEVEGLKFFMSSKGKIEQLKYLADNSILSIINRPCYENNRGTHYEVILGLDENFVYLHNPAKCAPTMGFHKRKHRNFMNNWWINERNSEHWYITATPIINNKSFILSKNVEKDSPAFIGKYA